MRKVVTAGIVAAFMGLTVAAAQPAPRQFRGSKLFDTSVPKTQERDVVVRVEADGVSIAASRGGTKLRQLSREGLVAEHALSAAPPVDAGVVAAASTQPMAAPTYMGKQLRHWVTLRSGDTTAVLRVSARVYEAMRAALAEHGVTMSEKEKK